ncbi:DUF5667 domain-containing protein [Halalkalibacter okhensis]|uniref:DUF5667 domain-containing protein n=1 Tax=Halalkalibacter okhensis TaxID=333138 RepID=A0A0B0IF53_9BACI|nr:DUF5667 domain-containing protein [Halalkalibacter okhensis]KHF38704.1 hypothetical protein LQ50_19705 [Halalkalibacter okhensis]
MKKLVIATTVCLLLVAGVVHANQEKDIVSPESELYETVRVIEETTIELTKDPGEKTLLEDEYAKNRLLEAEEMLAVGNEEAAESSIDDYNEHMDAIEKNLAEAKERGKDISEVEVIINENMEKRSENLRSLLDRDDIPEQAKAGITKAIENQAKAKQRAEEARSQARAKGNGASQEKGKQEKQKGQERAEQARQQGQERAEQGQANKPENPGRP